MRRTLYSQQNTTVKWQLQTHKTDNCGNEGRPLQTRGQTTADSEGSAGNGYFVVSKAALRTPENRGKFVTVSLDSIDFLFHPYILLSHHHYTYNVSKILIINNYLFQYLQSICFISIQQNIKIFSRKCFIKFLLAWRDKMGGEVDGGSSEGK